MVNETQFSCRIGLNTNIRSLPMSSPVVAILSHPLIIYHILTTLVISSKNHLIKGKEVIVHYLGPTALLDWMHAFSEISHLLNGSDSVHEFIYSWLGLRCQVIC